MGAYSADFGLCPYSFHPGSLSEHRNTSKTMAPINGIKLMKYHQPLLPVSCKRRTVTDIEGAKLMKL